MQIDEFKETVKGQKQGMQRGCHRCSAIRYYKGETKSNNVSYRTSSAQKGVGLFSHARNNIQISPQLCKRSKSALGRFLSGPCSFFLFFFFLKALLCHYPFTIARKRTECEDQGKTSHTHTQMENTHRHAHTELLKGAAFVLSPLQHLLQAICSHSSQMNFVTAFQILSRRCANERRQYNLN